MNPLSRVLVLAGLAAACLPIAPAQDDAASRRAAIEMMYPVMIQALDAKAFGRARNICDQAILWEPQNPAHHYNLACIEAQAGRLPQAMGALELSVALGFNDPQHLQADSDLAPLRRDPKFAEMVRKTMNNAGAASALAALTIPAAPQPAANAAPPAPANVEKPAPHGFKDGRPVGLFFMTRPSASPGSPEKAAWYFAPDGTVYRNLETGFSADDLAAHRGPKGTCRSAGDRLEVTWSDGRKIDSVLARSARGTGFRWNAGLFAAVQPFERASEIAAVYEGGETPAAGDGRAAAAQRLELRNDGTFTWTGVSLARAAGSAGQVSVRGGGSSTGTWQLHGLSLLLNDPSGALLRRIAFPCDDATTPLKPDHLFFGGLLYKRLP